MKETAAPTLSSQALHAFTSSWPPCWGSALCRRPQGTCLLPHTTTPRQVGMEGGTLLPAPNCLSLWGLLYSNCPVQGSKSFTFLWGRGGEPTVLTLHLCMVEPYTGSNQGPLRPLLTATARDLASLVTVCHLPPEIQVPVITSSIPCRPHIATFQGSQPRPLFQEASFLP
ncbi:Hypothetical predicted protein [Marmota monax]|uniref:Uncharacterized protein n=1 Tax=Marmota monax TaxID=9995 RepID=A0A5E4B3E4_MARMO|nr:hypothetical protein GHT09_011132 [Marmota monax]VTJ63182.1 Hypothetical predicted protein [Marmota monax]